jgi:hypothetical protein
VRFVMHVVAVAVPPFEPAGERAHGYRADKSQKQHDGFQFVGHVVYRMHGCD